MAGVTSDYVTIDLRDGVPVEFEIGEYFRRFTLSEAIARGRIEARLEDGVLQPLLPKAEKVLPRRDAV